MGSRPLTIHMGRHAYHIHLDCILGRVNFRSLHTFHYHQVHTFHTLCLASKIISTSTAYFSLSSAAYFSHSYVWPAKSYPLWPHTYHYLQVNAFHKKTIFTWRSILSEYYSRPKTSLFFIFVQLHFCHLSLQYFVVWYLWESFAWLAPLPWYTAPPTPPCRSHHDDDGEQEASHEPICAQQMYGMHIYKVCVCVFVSIDTLPPTARSLLFEESVNIWLKRALFEPTHCIWHCWLLRIQQ